MKLNDAPFETIKNGTKTIELRLYDEKRRKIKIGDTICFKGKAGTIKAIVKELHIFRNFDELYAIAEKRRTAKCVLLLLYYIFDLQSNMLF